MLNVQKYLRENGLEKLKEEFFINVFTNKTDNWMILNYDMLDSPRHHLICDECRSLVLEKETFNLVAKSFSRFYNLKEVQVEFDWSNFTSSEKHDGSLLNIFYYDNKWNVTTRGSDGKSKINKLEVTFHDIILPNLNTEKFNEEYNYIFEFTSIYNKVVRTYEKTTLYLLSIFEKGRELLIEEVDFEANRLGLSRPKVFKFKNIGDVLDFIREKEENDPTYEGVVLRDCNNVRLKVKSKTYLAFFHTKNNGNFNLKFLIPFIMDINDAEEFIVYFPEIKDYLFKQRDIIRNHYEKLEELWNNHKDLATKDFALAIKDETPFSSILFYAKKNNINLRESFLKSDSAVLKYLTPR